MKIGVYKITNTINSKVYIGSSEVIENRWKRHISDMKNNVHHSIHLQRAANKYGIKNFVFEILEECSIDILLEREQHYKDLYKSYIRKYGYDMCRYAGNCKGVKQSVTTISKRRKSIEKYWNKVGRPYKDFLEKRKEENMTLAENREIRNLKIVDLLKSGIEQKLIAKQYKLSPSKITFIKTKYNITTLPISNKGSNNGFSKLNESQVIDIKILLSNRSKYQEIANMFNVSIRTIKAIKSGQNWSHIII